MHGNITALQGICSILAKRGNPHMVFLGDYINKGSHSLEVMQELMAYARNGQATLLAGNHEIALLNALETGDLAAFLRIGGAMTIRSYVGPHVGADAFKDFRDGFPIEHLNFLRNMLKVYENDDLIAQHIPSTTATHKFLISAHIPTGKLPRIEQDSAYLDTGCGTQDGRLTALLWPSLDYVQVNSEGTIVSD
ncbi:metallophosphoesterase [Corynebacterium doosanense]|uniref:metallophosphoesterase n=1 Tax=Corynebacterium doosanense TaxID=1121358 RepID=UPI001FDF2EDE